jgi:Tfp pilus assembly protein PilW
MKPTNGFLLIELMIGLLMSIFFILIITHYIIEAKSTQQKALKRIESFSTARNEAERSL